MFEVGQLITGTERTMVFGIGGDQVLCIVMDTNPIRVRLVATDPRFIPTDQILAINGDLAQFECCTYEDFKRRNPNCVLLNGYTVEKLNKIIVGEKMEEKEMELRMNKETIGNYVLTKEERKTLKDQIINLLEEYDYNPTSVGVDNIIDEWEKNKGWMINLFKQHPNYNGKFQIVFDTDYNRVCDKRVLGSFANYLYDVSPSILKEKKLGAFSFKEVKDIYGRLKSVSASMSDIEYYGYSVLANGRTHEEIKKERDAWERKYNMYIKAENRGEIAISGGKTYERELYNLYYNLRTFADVVCNYTEHIATEEFVEKVNRCFPKVKAVTGQKVSRIVGKIAKITGIDKHENWNREFAKYSDAINPLSIKRHTILSCHPIDYFTMSFGNSWASCHTIDKQNKRKMPNDYSGCYSSGTLSYMLDESSFVFYTVDKDYDGDELELADKINRNMFHMGEDKLIQARVYPQATDGETGIYRQIREIAQKVIADCLGVSNMWKNVKGTGECEEMTSSYGTHYKDYLSFSDCNVSYLKDETDETNKKFIEIGHNPICPQCGKEHTWSDAVECQSCYEGRKICHVCGDSCDDEHMHYINGEWYCEDCCFYCEYHERWEIGDSDDYYYVNNYGKVCEDAFNSDSIFYICEHCGEYHCSDSYDDEHIETEDGTHFCCADHARRDGYLEVEGKWYLEDEVHYCEFCNEYVHDNDWNYDLNCCNDCAEDIEEAVTEDVENETEEREAV